MTILADPTRTVQHTDWCDTAWHDNETLRTLRMPDRDGSDPDLFPCTSASIPVPAGASHGDAVIWQDEDGDTLVSVEFPHRSLTLSAEDLDEMIETLTRLAVTARASQ